MSGKNENRKLPEENWREAEEKEHSIFKAVCGSGCSEEEPSVLKETD